MTALVGVSCDGCQQTLTVLTVVQASTGTVREEAKRRGWHKTRGTYEALSGVSYGYARDICPDCWTKGVR